ncbi:MAG: hypothetical protein AAF098_12475 [Pseudomonadota bacterium]
MSVLVDLLYIEGPVVGPSITKNEGQDPSHNRRNANRTRPRIVGVRLLYQPKGLWPQ